MGVRPMVCAGLTALLLAGPGWAHQGGGDGPVHVHDPLEFTPRGPGEAFGGGAWRMYGRDLANSRSNRRGGPDPTQARDLVGAWSFRSSDGGFTATPVVARRTVVISSNDGTVYALDAQNGQLRWSRDLVVSETREQIYATVAVVGGRVYVPRSRFGRPAIVALRLSSGEVLWETELDDQTGSDLFSSPVVWQGVAYAGVAGGYGEHFDPDPRIRGSVAAIDAQTGELLWKRYTVPEGYDGGSIWTTAAIDPVRRRLYFGSGNAYNPPAWDTTDAILSFGIGAGRLLGGFQATAEDIYHHHRDNPSRDLDFGSSPNLFRSGTGRLLVGALQKSRIYWALDARTMERVWSRQTGTSKGRYFQDTLASTAYDGKRIYGQNDDGQIWALSPSGSRLWVTKASGESNYSPVAAATGVVYVVRDAGYLEARRASTGRRLARLRLGSPSWGGVSVVGGWVFVTTGTTDTDAGYVVAYRPR